MGWKRPQVVAVVAEKEIYQVLKTGMDIALPEEPLADRLELWLDCLDPRKLNERNLSMILSGIHHPAKKIPLTVSIRHIDSVPPEQKHYRGFKGDFNDHDRNSLLREVVKNQPDYLELEHNHRWGLLFSNMQTIIRHCDFLQTPSYDELRKIFDDIKRVGADIVKIETYARDEHDLETLRRLRHEHAKDEPLITLSLGKRGKNMWLEACEDGSPFVYGHTKKMLDYLFGKKKPHDYMPSLEEIHNRLVKVEKRNR